MKVVFVEPHEKPRVIDIENTLEAKQRVVGGLIEIGYFNDDDSVCIISNEEAKVIGMDGNRRTDAGIIAGPFFVCGLDEDNFRGLTDEEADKYMKVFEKPEDISQEEINEEMNSGIQFFIF